MDHQERKIVLQDPAPGTYIFREGKALELPEPRALHIDGMLGCVAEYIAARNPKKVNSHIVVNYEAGQIILEDVDDYDQGGALITGKIQPDPYLTRFLAKKNFNTAKECAEHLRRHRRFFKDMAEATTLLTQLMKFNAEVVKVFADEDDKRGNTKALIDVNTKHGLPESFVMAMPILKHGDVLKFKVDIFVEKRSAGVTIIFESMELEELRDKLYIEEIDKNLAQIKGLSEFDQLPIFTV